MYTLAKQHTLTKEIKKSRFIAIAIPVESPEQALEQLAGVRDSEANHNCWAYKVGDQYRFSDDGEPGGTAGKPILAMLDGEGALVVNESNSGYTCGAGNYHLLTENILAMSRLNKDELQQLGINAKKYAQREFERNKLISQLEQWLSELVHPTKCKIGTLWSY